MENGVFKIHLLKHFLSQLAPPLRDGCFGRLDHHQLVALASCFMPVEKVKNFVMSAETKSALDGPMRELKETARMVAEVQKECKLEIEVDDFVDSFKPVLVEVVYHWSKGVHFDEVCKKTDLFEGTVIRALRRGIACALVCVLVTVESGAKFFFGIRESSYLKTNFEIHSFLTTRNRTPFRAIGQTGSQLAPPHYRWVNWVSELGELGVRIG